MTDRIRTRKAIAKVIKLRDKIYRSSGTLVGSKFTKASERLQYLLLLLSYRGVDTSRLQADLNCPLTMRPFIGPKIIKSYVYFSVILWYPNLQVSSVQFTVFFIWLLNEYFFPQTYTVYQNIAISLLAMLLVSYLLACC